jgi:quercetin dioxygenase-like cupin family protein
MAFSEPVVTTTAPNIAQGTLSRLNEIKLTRWHGAQHPTLQVITRQMEQEGLRPYSWSNGPNFRIAARSHGSTKIMYCIEGSLELVLPDINQSIVLRPGDRVELPRGVRHAAMTGPRGARCLECTR